VADRMTITVDTTALLAALDALPDRVHAHLKAAAKITAENIAREARARVARRTGETAAHIRVEETHSGDGYIVWVAPEVRVSHHTMPSGRSHTQKVTYNALAGWLEFGTRHMPARPFLFVSARLEEGAHDRRCREAVQAAIDETGLGE
jgi:HK97 gp10 family phage protein